MSHADTATLFDLHGRHALVTGAGRGIGRAIALGLAGAGAEVMLASRSGDELDEACAAIASAGGRAHARPTDVADLDALGDLFVAADREFEALDIVVNAAGMGFRKSSLDVTPAEWDEVHDLNLRSAFFACQQALRRMTAQDYGRVINVASLTSYIGFANVAAYGASKGGVAQLTKALAVEFAGTGTTVNALAPGYVYTKLTKPRFDDPSTRDWIMSRIPMDRHGQPDDMTGTAVFLASPAAAYLTGVVIPVDGGWLAA